MTNKFIITMIFVVIGYIINAGSVLAAPAVVCHSERMDKTFVINNNKVAMYKGEADESYRGIASTVQVRTRFTGSGFNKVMNYEGHKYTISVKNVKSFSPIEDYISIRSTRGHEITYPLECALK